MLFPDLTKTDKLHSDGYYNVPSQFNLKEDKVYHDGNSANLMDFRHKKRMWKGGNIRYMKNQLKTHQKVYQLLSLKSIATKNTSRGKGIFTTELREIYNDHGLSVVEERTLVYLDENSKDQSRILKRNLVPDYSVSLIPSEEMLFRYVYYSILNSC